MPASAPFRSVLWASTVLAGLSACGANQPSPVLGSVEPGVAFNDQDTDSMLTLTGTGFVPEYDFDINTGVRTINPYGFSGRIGREPTWARLQNFVWLSPT